MKKKSRVYVSEDAPNIAGNLAIVFTSLLLVVLGLVMLFAGEVQLVYFCYGAGACLLVWGIWLISRYFLRHEFQETTNYGFSIGTLVVILGAVDLIRAKEIAESLPDYLGIIVLIEGVVMLQNTVQLKNLRGKLWAVSLLFSLLSVAASLVILLDVGHMISKNGMILYLLLIAVGVFTLISLCFVAWRTKKYHKEIDRENSRHLEELEEWYAGKEREKTKEAEQDGVDGDGGVEAEAAQDTAAAAEAEEQEEPAQRED